MLEWHIFNSNYASIILHITMVNLLKYCEVYHDLASALKDWKEQIPGGLAQGEVPQDFDPEQLAMGVKVEMEHTNDPRKALEIAMDHLMEDDHYYDKLQKMEKEFEEE